MASWLASQLQKAENLLEAVDRTVSSATGQQVKGPVSDGQTASKVAVSSIYSRPTAGQPFNSFTASDATHLQGSPVRCSSSEDNQQQSHIPGISSGAAPSAAPPPVECQQPPWQPAAASSNHVPPVSTSPAQGSASASYGPPQPTDDAAIQPSSTGSYTVRTHGPFSPTPETQSQPEPMPPPPTAFSTWGPPHPHPAAATATAAFTGPVVAAAPTDTSSTEYPGGVSAMAAESTATPVVTSTLSQQSYYPEEAAAAVANYLGVGAAANGPASAVQQPVPDDKQLEQQMAAVVYPVETQQEVTAANTSEPAALPLPEEKRLATAAFADFAAELSSSETSSRPAAEEAPPAATVLKEQQQKQQASDAFDGAANSSSSSTADPSNSQQLGPSVDGSSATTAAAGPSSNPGSSSNDSQLMRLVETLRKRLDQVKAENQQLEDLVHSAEQATAAEQQRAQQLAAELASMQRSQDEIVSSAAANAAAQDARVGRLQQELEAAKRQVVALQGALESVQEQHQQLLSSKDSMEGGALEALRSQLSTSESQLESERRAHAATKAAALARERDLEEQLASSSEALAVTQRQLEDLASRGRELEEQQAVTVAEAARLREQVRQLCEQQVAGQQPDPQHQLQLEAEVEAFTLRLHEAQAALQQATEGQHTAEAQVVALQQEIAQIHSSYQASAAARGPPQLEQQVHELQELLYQKQQQLERLAGEKQAQQLLLERQVTTLRSELGKVHAAAAAAQTSSSVRVGHDIIPMDALGEPYQRLARHRKLGGAVQATANFLDRTAASASQLLRQQPLARLIVFLYIVLIHLYVYFLLARMQRQAVLMLAAHDKGAAGHEPALPGTH